MPRRYARAPTLTHIARRVTARLGGQFCATCAATTTSPVAHIKTIASLVPIELGGAGGDERNLWAQPTAESILKDRVEDALQRAVCREHRIPLVQAQAEIARDWRHTSVGEPANLPHAYVEDQ
jgi:hypothetical protein